MKTQKGFTLIELMIAVVIIAIVTMIAVPSYQASQQRSARANAQSDLMIAAGTLERRNAQNFTYGGATVGTTSTSTISSMSPREASAGQQKYNITLTYLNSAGAATTGTDIAGFELKAVSTALFARNKSEAIKIDNRGRKCISAFAPGKTDCVYGTDKTW